MMAIYVMRRANGDWFAMEGKAGPCVPLFHSSHDAMMARLRNFGMLLYEPVAIDAQLLKEIKAADVDDAAFCIVDDPFANLTRSPHILPAQLSLLMSASAAPQSASGREMDFTSQPVESSQNEWWI